MLSFLSLFAVLFITSGYGMKVFCDFKNSGGCFSEFKDPMHCSDVNREVTTFYDVKSTSRYDEDLRKFNLYGKLVFFEVTNKMEFSQYFLDIRGFYYTPYVASERSVVRMKNSLSDGEFNILPHVARLPGQWCMVNSSRLTASLELLGPDDGTKLYRLGVTVPIGVKCVARR